MEKLMQILESFENEPSASVYYTVLRGYPHLKDVVTKYLNARHKLMAEILLVIDTSTPGK